MQDYNNLDRFRKQKFMSVLKLSELSGVSQEDIFRLEGANSFPDDVKIEIALAEALDVDPKKLFVRSID